jgi:hypothetical protein
LWEFFPESSAPKIISEPVPKRQSRRFDTIPIGLRDGVRKTVFGMDLYLDVKSKLINTLAQGY